MARRRPQHPSEITRVVYYAPANRHENSHRLECLSRWKIYLVEIGSLLIFAATYGQYVAREVWSIIGPLFHK
jgi:hypothetical protein